LPQTLLENQERGFSFQQIRCVYQMATASWFLAVFDTFPCGKQRFMIKVMTAREKDLMLKILQPYYTRITESIGEDG
jgi:hypothetical protein